MPKTVIFDFDGTIADSIPDNKNIQKIFNKIANENNFKSLTLPEIEALRDVGLYESIKLLKIPFYKLPFIAKRVREVTKADFVVAKPIKNIPTTLKNLKNAGYSLGIMTSNKKEPVEKFLKKHNLEIFDFVHSGSNLFGKDRHLKGILKKLKIEPNEAIYVGDEIRDVQATKKVNLSFIGVTWGYNTKKGLIKFNADFIAEKPSDIEKIVAKYFKK